MAMNCYNPNTPEYDRVLMAVQDCEAMCEHTITMVHRMMEGRNRARQLSLLRDCADICGLTAKYVARRSMYARHIAHLCAMICEACGNECLRHSDQASQHCGYVCLDCARECRAFAQMGSGNNGNNNNNHTHTYTYAFSQDDDE